MKNKSVIALMLAFTMCFTSVCPAFAAENTAVETEAAKESESGEPADSAGNVAAPETSDEDAPAAEESVSEEQAPKAEETPAVPELTGTITISVDGQTVTLENGGEESPEDLFEKYLDNAFSLSGSSSRRKLKKSTGTRLSGNEAAAYRVIAGELPAVAAGERASTAFLITKDDLGLDKTVWTAEELGVPSILETNEAGQTIISPKAQDAAVAKVSFDLNRLTDALLADFPYELYWFDKSAGIGTSKIDISAYTSGGEAYIEVSSDNYIQFSVAGEFAAGEYTVKTEVGQSVQTAVNNANDIVNQYSGASDEDKLQGYKDEICDLVAYNNDAAAGNFSYNYGNPWQLLWVFDGDDTTKVVCEGYSKAFKYLCDKSDFDSNIRCILVSGTMDGGEGAGNHMWNIVKKGDGYNYLVDVTNCDEGTIGAPDQLFLKRTDELYTDDKGTEFGYLFHLDGGDIEYIYSDDTLGYYTQEELSLGEVQHVHNMTKTDAKAATCTENGNIEYWTCSECGRIYSDAEGTEEITLEDTVVKAAGHKLEKTEAKDATCTENGNIAFWTCSECGKIYSDSEGTKEITAEDTVTEAIGHKLEKTDAKAATCTENGNIAFWTCSKCGKIFSDAEGTKEIAEEDTVTEAIGHDWTEWVTVKEATEEEAGLEVRTCRNDESHKEEREIPKLTHVHELEKTDAKDATCTEDGNIAFWTCSKCGKIFSDAEGTKEITAEDTVTEAIGHDWTDWKTVKEATEEETGLEVRACRNDESHKEEREIPKLTHVHELTKTEGKAVTCTEDGNIAFWTCSKCGKIYSDAEGTEEITLEDTVIRTLGHNWSGWTVITEATCTEEGSREKSCRNCGETVTEVINARGHQWNKEYTVDKEATCAEEGSESIHCEVCDEIREGTSRVIEKTQDHKYGAWTVTKEATETETGLREKVCTVCGDKVEEEIPVLKGTWKKDSKGWWYQWNNNSYPKDRMLEIDGATYYFDGAGYMATGWQSIYVEWYYFDTSGAMVKGWKQVGGKWYYFDGDGVMVTGLQKLDGKNYLFNGSGAMVTGWQSMDGKWYYFDPSGAMAEGWKQIDGKWYYLASWEDGAMLTGIQELDGKKYYFNGSGAMATGWQSADGKWYYFEGSGAMKTGWLQSGGKWYYLDPWENGEMVTGLKKLDGATYFFNGSGVMSTGWQSVDGKWYYFEGSGAMAVSKWVGDYYLGKDGVMATNSWIGGYYVGSDGKWIPGYKAAN